MILQLALIVGAIVALLVHQTEFAGVFLGAFFLTVVL